MDNLDYKILLEISQAIAAIQNHEQLLKVIFERVQPVFGFHDVGLFVFSKDGESATDWAAAYSNISPSPGNRQVKQFGIETVTLDKTPLRAVVNQLAEADAPLVIPYDKALIELASDESLRATLKKILEENGYREFLATTLKTGGKLLGLLFLNSKQNNFFHSEQFALFQAVADQIAVAVANILANEEIIEREREKSVLLSISEDVSLIRDRDTLFATVAEKVRPMFGFIDAGIVVLTKDRQHYSHLFAEGESRVQQHPDWQILSKPLPMNPFVKSVIDSPTPVLTTTAELLREYSNHEGVQMMREKGIVQSHFCALRTGGEAIGFLILHFDSTRQISETESVRLQNVGNQLAVAVANVLANEEIIEREREKSQLLAISEQLATIRDKHDLFDVIFDKLKPVFNFDDAVITLCDEKLEYTRHLHTAANDEQQNNHHYQILMTSEKPIENSPYEEIVTFDLPRIVNLEKWIGKYPNDLGVKVAVDFGLIESVLMPLRYGGKLLGIFEFHTQESGRFVDSQMPLFRNLADQMAVAVSNILANEKIIEREREKSKLLEVTEMIAQVKATDDLLKLIVHKIKPLFNFHDCGLFVISPDGETHTDLAAVLPDVSPSEWNETIAAVSQNIPHRGSVIEWWINQIESQKSPLIFSFKELIEKFPDYPQFQPLDLLEAGYGDCLGANLTVRGKPIGFFCINTLTPNHFPESVIPLFQAVTNSISIAVANILANEEIIEREREKSKLLSISEHIAQVQNRQQLLEVIFTTIKTIFPYDDAGLFYFCDRDGKPNPNGEYHIFLLDDVLTEVNVEIAKQEITGVLGERTDAVRYHAQDNPMLTTTEDLIERFPGHPFFPIMQQDGIKQFISTGIKIGGETIGMLSFNSRQENFYDEKDFPMFENIANQISIAVANILANEEIIEREREKSTLLSISEDIASARNAVELLQIIREKAQRLIPFHDTGILIVEEDGEHHYDLAVNLPEWDATEGNRRLHAAGLHQMIHPDSYIAHVMQLVETADSPVLEDYELRYKQFDYPFFSMMEEVGYKEGIVTELKTRGKVFGTLWLNSLEKNHFSPKQFEIFQALADQVAVAVANILANEEILEREREKSKLLKISEAIARITDRNDLLQVIIEQVQPVFQFDDNALFVIDPDGQHYRMWYANLSVEYEEGRQSKSGQGIPIAGNPIAADVFERPAHIIGRDEMLKAAADNASVTQWVLDSGTEETLIAPLRVGGRVVGCFNSHSRRSGTFSSDKLPLYQNVADQIAVAVANILANEEIIEREQEKSVLLSITEALAAIRNRDELLAFILEKVQPLLGFNQYAGVMVLNEADNKLYNFFTTATPEELEAQAVQPMLKGFAPEGRFGKILNSREPVVIDDSWIYQEQSCEADRLAAEVWKELNFKQSVSVSLRYGNRVIGSFHTHYFEAVSITESRLRWFEGIADQLAVAVANILANEEIIEREKEKALLLNLSEGLANIRSREELWQTLQDRMRPFFSYSESSTIYIFDRNQDLRILENVEGSLYSYEPFLKSLKNNSSLKTENTPFEELKQLNSVLIKRTSDWLSEYPEFWGLTICRDLDIEHLMFAPIVYQGKTLGFWNIGSKTRNYTEADKPLFQSITEQLSVSVANILANEEIVEREREKALLLSLSEDMATIRDRDDLWRVMMEKIRPLVEFDDAVVITFSDDYNSANHILTVAPPERQAHPGYQEIIGKPIPISGTPAEYTMKREGNFIFSTDELLAIFPDYPGLVLMRETGLEYTIHFKLNWGGRLIGQFHLHFAQREQIQDAKFDLYKAIADQVTVAVANILANEEIIEREREKALLLSLSEDMATIRDRNDLWRVIMEKIRPLVNFEDAVVMALSKDKQFCNHILTASPANRREKAFHQKVFNSWLPVEGTFKILFGLEEVAYWSVLDMAKDFPEHEGVQFMISEELFHTQQFRLNWAGDYIGIFQLHFKRKEDIQTGKLNLYKAIADQVAVAVANILANEEVLRLAEERRERAEELARTNDAVQRSTLGLSSLDNIERFIESVLAEIIRETEARGTGIFQITPDGEHLRLTHYLEGSEMFDVATDPRLAVWRDAKSIGQSKAAERMAKGELVWISRDAEEFGDDWKEPLAAHWLAGHKIIACVPFVIGGEFTGFVGISFGEAVNPTEQKMQMCQTLAQHAALALHLRLLSREAEHAAHESAALNERNRIAREIHDTLAQGFTGIVVQLEAANRVFDKDSEQARPRISRAIELARESLAEARRSVRALRPVALEETDLPGALLRLGESFTASTETNAEVLVSGTPRALHGDTSAHLLRITQEALTNAVRHAAASRVRIELSYTDTGAVRLCVQDDGRGFDAAAARGGFGLTGMSERAATLGTQLNIRSAPGEGTRVAIEVKADGANQESRQQEFDLSDTGREGSASEAR